VERLIRFFVQRHLLVNVITIAVVVVGISMVSRMNVDGFPNIDMPRFIVSASLPGASARDVETKVTIPIEEAISEVDSLNTYYTVITDNRSVTTIELDDDTPQADILEKEREIRNELDRISDFPPEMTDDPVLIRLDPSKIPVLEIALSGPADAVAEATRRLERRLERAPSVAETSVVGLPDPELRVFVDPDLARAHGVALLDVVEALQRRNVSSTGGELETAEARRQVALWGRFENPDEAGDAILRFDDGGGALRVRDVARLELGREDVQLRAGTNGRPGVSVIVTKRADADIIETRRQVLAVLEGTALPDGVDGVIVNDTTFEIRNRLRVLASNGAIGVVLVASIVFLFLAPSAAIWVCAGVPIVILAVLMVMPAFDMGINFISTIGFVVMLGLLVDDAVVVAEKILLRRQDGTSPADAATTGAASMVRPVVAAAITTVLAFVPMFAIGGMPGRLIWQIPAVVSLALAFSLLESFVILPAHMSMVRSNTAPRPKRAFMLRLEAAYRALLGRALPRRGRVIAGYAAAFAFVMLGIAPQMEFEFFPQNSSPAFSLKVSTTPGTPIEQTEAVLNAIEAQIPALMGDDLLATTFRVGHQDTQAFDREYGSASHEGIVTAYIDLSRNERISAEWIAELKRELVLPPGVTVFYEADIDGPPGLEPVAVHVLGSDDEARRKVANEVRDQLERFGGLADLDINERLGIRQIDLNLDYEDLARRGLDVEDVARTLKTAYYGAVASEIRDLEDTTEIRVLFEPAARRSLDGLLDTPMRNRRGELVALRDVVEPVEMASLASIYHREGIRAATISGGFEAGSGLTAESVAQRIEREILPRYADRHDVEILIDGEAVQSRRATGDMGTVGVIAILGIAAIMTIMLGSFVEAFFVISIVPFAFAAVVLVFFFHGMHFSMFALIGGIGLAGVVVNSSIVMVDAVHRAQHGLESDDPTRTTAMIDALVGRLRPILVTTLSTLGGVIPTAYGFGGYDYVLGPMSLALGWGLAISTGVTLFLLPCLYVTANDLARSLDDWRERRNPVT
jgi:multidrug efflux pump subunit AcrB